MFDLPKVKETNLISFVLGVQYIAAISPGFCIQESLGLPWAFWGSH